MAADVHVRVSARTDSQAETHLSATGARALGVRVTPLHGWGILIAMPFERPAGLDRLITYSTSFEG